MRGPSSWHAGTSNANKPLGGAFGHGGYYSYANDKRRGRSGDVNMKAYFFLVRKLQYTVGFYTAWRESLC